MNILPNDPKALTEAFPHRPFGLRHRFVNHPLLTLPRIAELVQELPRDRIEYNSGKVAISQDPNAVPTLDLDPEQIVRNIETCGAWMVLKHIETSPSYRTLIQEALLEVARARGHASIADAGFDDIQGFLFVSSADSTTPFHADSDENFFFQIYGEKFFHVYDNSDGSIASDAALEEVVVKHRNIPHDPKFDDKRTTYRLLPSDGVFVPYQWPHWVRTADSYSISLSITWKSDDVRRRNEIFTVNSMLRSIGIPQSPPGVNAALDAIKVAMFRAISGAVAPLRRSESVRRILRRIALGRHANYYYRAGAKKDQRGAARA